MTMSGLIKKLGVKLNEYAPEILIGVGITGMINGTVMACKATMKIDEIKASTEKKRLEIQTFISEDYSEDDRSSDLLLNDRRGKLEIVKEYIPSALVMTAGIASIITGATMLSSRNTELKGAFNALFSEFAAYRKDISENFGEEVDRKIKLKAKETVNEETGEVYNVVDANDISDLSTLMVGPGDYGYDEDRAITLEWIKYSMAELQSQFEMDGYLLLTDVYRKFGKQLPKGRGKALTLGWVFNPKNAKFHNYVDCGIFNAKRKSTADFLNGLEDAVVLEFNIDGDISDYI